MAEKTFEEKYLEDYTEWKDKHVLKIGTLAKNGFVLADVTIKIETSEQAEAYLQYSPRQSNLVAHSFRLPVIQVQEMGHGYFGMNLSSCRLLPENVVEMKEYLEAMSYFCDTINKQLKVRYQELEKVC